jgi:hypothetical protein
MSIPPGSASSGWACADRAARSPAACPDRRCDQRDHRPCHGGGLLRSGCGYDFRNRRPGCQVHLHHQRGAVRLCHERGLLGRHRLLPGRIGPRDPGHSHGTDRRGGPQAEQPPNFNDQCAAFISSDIKNAIHDGVPHADITAGLVYSICMNYNNRVKGNRPMGRKSSCRAGSATTTPFRWPWPP